MIPFVKEFFRRRAARAATDAALARWEFDGVFTCDGGGSCHLCGERTIELSRRYEKRSLTGGRFVFSTRVAFACRRCQTVSCVSDCSSNPVHVSEWVPSR